VNRLTSHFEGKELKDTFLDAISHIPKEDIDTDVLEQVFLDITLPSGEHICCESAENFFIPPLEPMSFSSNLQSAPNLYDWLDKRLYSTGPDQFRTCAHGRTGWNIFGQWCGCEHCRRDNPYRALFFETRPNQ
jgi:hypothetical protein